MKRVSFIAAVLIGWLGSLTAYGQGLIVPEPRHIPIAGAFAVKNITVDATVKDQVAEVQLSQIFRNTGSQQMEVSYVFPVPPDAVVSQFVLLIDGKEVPAKVYTKEEAQRIYESIVRTRKDPAILEYMGYGAVQTQVFPLPPNGERKITLRYSQVCRRDQAVTEFLLPLVSGKLSSKPVEQLRVTVRIEDKGRIKSVYSPTYAINAERPSEQSAIVRLAQDHVQPSEDLRLFWDLSEKPIGATVMSYRPQGGEDGYFLMLLSPEVKASEASISSKSVVFVLDHSGSMAGPKIEQARNALKFVLNNLREGDTFNIVAYDDRVETFKPEMQRFNDQTRQEALRFVDGIHDGGSTNIDGALRRTFEMLGNPGRPAYVIFLTDGLPTAGEQRPAMIAANAKTANRNGARLFAFGVGFDVNAQLLDKLTTENSGTSEYVRPNEDIEAHVSKFYGKMTAPVMTNLKLDLTSAEANRLYPREMPDLFAGSQAICVGRYRTAGQSTIRLTGKVAQNEQAFEFPIQLAAASSNETYGFVEKLWATRRIGEIINELDLKGRNQELIDELVRLSTQHGILTPYTAFLADERTNLVATRDNAVKAGQYAFDRPESLAQNVSGGTAVNLRMSKQKMQAAMMAPGQGQQGYMDGTGQYRVESNCQVVGNKALFRRANQWVDPTITPEEQKKAEVVEQFSDRYFELAKNNANLRRYLALPEGCTVKVDGRVYQINASQQNRAG